MTLSATGEMKVTYKATPQTAVKIYKAYQTASCDLGDRLEIWRGGTRIQPARLEAGQDACLVESDESPEAPRVVISAPVTIASSDRGRSAEHVVRILEKPGECYPKSVAEILGTLTEETMFEEKSGGGKMDVKLETKGSVTPVDG